MGRGPRRIAGTLVILALLTAAAPLSIDIYTPSLPRMQEELGGADWLAQASITACLLGIGIGQLFWGPLSDRFGRRPVVLAGATGWVLTSLASALATSPEALVAARGIAGLCGAAGIVVSRSIVRDLSPDDRVTSARIGALAMATAVAPVIAPALGAGIAAAWGWRADFLALAAFGAAIAIVFALAVPESLAAARRAAGGLASVPRALTTALRDRELRNVALALGAHSVGFYAYIAGASFIVERELGHPPVVFVLVFGVNAAAMLAANLLFRRLSARRPPRLPLGVGLAASTASGLVLLGCGLAGGPEWALWAASTVLAGATGLVLPGAHSWGQATAVASGAASALTGSAQFLGGVLGSPLTGAFGSTAGVLGLVVALASALGLTAWVSARRDLGGRRP